MNEIIDYINTAHATSNPYEANWDVLLLLPIALTFIGLTCTLLMHQDDTLFRDVNDK